LLPAKGRKLEPTASYSLDEKDLTTPIDICMGGFLKVACYLCCYLPWYTTSIYT